MSWTKLGAKKAREAMGRETEYDFDPADIAREAANEITGTDVQTSPPPLRSGNMSVGTSDPSAVRTLEQGTEMREEGKKRPQDKCSNAFLKKNWEAWRKLAKSQCSDPPKAEVRKSFLHYADFELHGVKVDWSTVDLSVALDTI
ncbi:hypothetical protein R1sor_017850 [Riccia sorocarpa]|uniref:Uncharacterized protein n=1 Tax=Riccia sorocarpa TaxID=122646 RepID=A0ABD3I844_9MARC